MKTVKFMMMTLMMCLCLGKSINVFSQSNISEYKLKYFEKTYIVAASQDEKKQTYKLYVDAESIDATSKQVSLIFNETELSKFKIMLDSASIIYKTWSEIAKNNNVTELSKSLSIGSLNIGVAFSYGGWNFDFSVPLEFRFKIVDEKYLLIIENKTDLQSSSNQFINSDGFLIVFSSSEEIKLFNDSLSLQLAKDLFNKKNSNDNLFK